MACFVAGTYVLALDGFKRIEDIVAGDKIMAADPETFEIAEKTVLETYVRQVDKLVHITINGEEIITTDNHPFYVQGRGFIGAGSLLVGDKLISVNGEDLLIENYNIEVVEELVQVYNFQVEDCHTYHVGNNTILVYNAGSNYAETPLPNFDKAEINPKKLTDYALNPDHPVGGNKARVFKSALGYDKNNAGELIEQIYSKLPESEAVMGKLDQYGQRYTVDMSITGVNGNTATVRTGWIIKTECEIPSLTTLYIP